MEIHILNYNKYFNYKKGDPKFCEISGKRLEDHHHIFNKGMGGSKELDFVENIIGLTRLFHNFFGDVEEYIEFLQEVHAHFMETRVCWAEAFPGDYRIWLPYKRNFKVDWSKI